MILQDSVQIWRENIMYLVIYNTSTRPDLCKENVVSNIDSDVQMKQWGFPLIYRPVKYETLTADVFNMTKRILKFLGLNYHSDIKKYLLSHTKYNAGSAFSTVRDTQAAASHWLQEWADGYKVIDSIQKSCVAAMNLWGYQNVTESDLMQLQSLE